MANNVGNKLTSQNSFALPCIIPPRSSWLNKIVNWPVKTIGASGGDNIEFGVVSYRIQHILFFSTYFLLW